jgi:spore coat protein U-like protein
VAVAIASMAVSGAAAAATVSSTMTVDATLVNACEVSPTSAIHFGSFPALLSSTDKTADSGSTFQVACSSGAVPKIYTLSTRTLVSGANSFPFNLSLTSGAAADDLPATGVTGVDPGMAKDGAFHDVTIYASIAAANYSTKPAGAYTRAVTLSVDY